MAAYSLRVRNFLGIKKADLTLDKIVLVAGVNGAGKSSLIEALAAVALETPLARGMRSKSAAAKLLHNGAEAGSIALDWAGGGRRILYPQAEIEVAGKPVQLGTSLGIGSARLMGLKADERTSQMTMRFQLEPRLDDLRAYFADKLDAAGVHTVTDADGTKTDPIAILWDRIEMSGWDAIHRACAEYSSKTKGAWQATTNIGWGSSKAKNWCPTELLPGEKYNIDEVRAAIVDAKAEVELLIAKEAVAGRDRDLLETLASGEKAAEATIAELTKQHTKLSSSIEAMMEWIAANPVPMDTSSLPTCPHCQKPLLVSMVGVAARAKPKLQAVDGEPKTKAQVKAALEAFDKQQEELDVAKRALTDVIGALANARTALGKASEAAVELEDLYVNPRPGVGEGAIDQARTLVSDLERKATAIDNQARAKGYYEEWVRNQIVVEALAPDGVRRNALEAKLGFVNTKLEDFSIKARWETNGHAALVEMTADMDATYDGRPYALLSESERWRVDITLTALLNRQEGAHLILMDRLDILAPQSRPGALYLLRYLGIPALVGMTAKSFNGKDPSDPPPVPDIGKAKLGTRHWLENGTIIDQGR